MRLRILENGHRALQRLQLFLIRRRAGYVPGPVAVMSYRRDFFGKHFAACLQEAMREIRCWRRAEVELFAAFVSKLNACVY